MRRGGGNIHEAEKGVGPNKTNSALNKNAWRYIGVKTRKVGHGRGEMPKRVKDT